MEIILDAEKVKRSLRIFRTRRMSRRRLKTANSLGYWGGKEVTSHFYHKRSISGHHHACHLCNREKLKGTRRHSERTRMAMWEEIE